MNDRKKSGNLDEEKTKIAKKKRKRLGSLIRNCDVTFTDLNTNVLHEFACTEEYETEKSYYDRKCSKKTQIITARIIHYRMRVYHIRTAFVGHELVDPK